MIVDGLGSSETGGQMSARVARAAPRRRARSRRRPGNHVLVGRPRPRVLEPGDDEIGWLAKAGRLAARLPRRRREDGPHLPGHRRRALLGARRPGPAAADGRSSSCTAATRSRSTPAARRSSPRRSSRRSRTTRPCTTCVVAGRPSERWGQEVVAVVQLRDGVRRRPTEADAARRRPSSHIARYKLPKAFVFVDEVVRSPSRQGRLPLGAHDRRRLTPSPSVLRRDNRQLWRSTRPRTTMGPWITWSATCSRSRSSWRSSACWCRPFAGCDEARSTSCGVKSAGARRRVPTPTASTAAQFGSSPDGMRTA